MYYWECDVNSRASSKYNTCHVAGLVLQADEGRSIFLYMRIGKLAAAIASTHRLSAGYRPLGEYVCRLALEKDMCRSSIRTTDAHKVEIVAVAETDAGCERDIQIPQALACNAWVGL